MRANNSDWKTKLFLELYQTIQTREFRPSWNSPPAKFGGKDKVSFSNSKGRRESTIRIERQSFLRIVRQKPDWKVKTFIAIQANSDWKGTSLFSRIATSQNSDWKGQRPGFASHKHPDWKASLYRGSVSRPEISKQTEIWNLRNSEGKTTSLSRIPEGATSPQFGLKDYSLFLELYSQAIKNGGLTS